MSGLDEHLVREAIDYLDEILDREAVGFVHLDRGELVERIERIRVAATSAKYVLAERRSLRLNEERSGET